MHRGLAVFVLTFAFFGSARGQSAAARDSDLVTLRSAMTRATKAYEAFNVEGAVPLLDMVVARRDIVPSQEMAAAYKLLGAAHAVLGHRDRAKDYYIEALKLDSTTTLDPAKFSATEMSPFFDAKRATAPSSVESAMQTAGKAEIRIGAPSPNSFFYLDDRLVGPISALRSWTVPAGRPVTISIRSANCSTPWDSTVIVPPGGQLTIGRRSARGCR
jgi:hypothetical protein